jgi:hypothetical protein
MPDKKNTQKKKKDSMKNILVGFTPSFLHELDVYLENEMPGIKRNSFIRMATIAHLKKLKKNI